MTYSEYEFTAVAALNWGGGLCGKSESFQRSLPTEAKGLPLSLVVAVANTHDIKLVAETLDALQTGKPGKKVNRSIATIRHTSKRNEN